ncbi:MAG: GxxExxY protein [Bacteroidetes bacterium]|nr:GxxExxY protein [Bacteroidota bacterium]
MELILQDAQEIYYAKDKYPMQEDSFEIIGLCMEVHKVLGRGLSEIVYKDAIEFELRNKNISFERERKYEVEYKGTILPHYYFADFVIDEKIILEVKAQEGVLEDHYRQVINYLAVSKLKLGLLINFGENSLKFKRVIL